MKIALLTLLFTITSTSAAFAYELKMFIVEGYSRPWVALMSDQRSSAKITDIHIHFHGWTQNPDSGIAFNSKYDFDWKNPKESPSESNVKKFIEAYGMQSELIQNTDRVILIPLSRGHCDNYVDLRDGTKFDMVLSKVLSELGLDTKSAIISHLSAHSGGGSLLSTLLKKSSMSWFFAGVSKVSLYDAIYSEEEAYGIKGWITKNKLGLLKKLKLYSIPNQSPSRFGSQIYSSVATAETIKTIDVDGVQLLQKNKITPNGDWISIIHEKKPPYQINHWSLVSSAWNL